MYPAAYFPDENRIPASALVLGLVGVIPFWLATFLLWSTTDPVGAGRASVIAIAYGAVILSFLGGIRWGLEIAPHTRTVATATLVLSVLPGLAGFAVMFMPVLVALTVLVCGFMLHALWDVLAADKGYLPQWFATLRMLLTAIVVPALLLLISKLVATALL